MRAGVAQEKITPKLGGYLGGYWNTRIARSVKSDLYAKAIVLECDGKRMAIVANDLIGMVPEIAAAARKRIAEQCGIAPEAVMICATHTHTGPEIRDRKDRSYGSDPAYNAELAKKIASVVESTCRNLFEAEIAVGLGDAEGYAKCRYVRLKDGRDVATYSDPPRVPGYDAEVVGWAGALDNSVQTLCLEDAKSRVRAMAVNFAAHPNAGKKATYYWAEWPGDTAKRIAEEYGHDVPCLLLQGAAGDVQCAPKMTREQVGKAIAEVAIKAHEKAAQPPANPVLDWRMEMLEIPCCSRIELAEVIAWYRRKKNLADHEKRLMDRLTEFYEVWDKEGRTLRLPVQCFRIGDVAVVGLPGEPFTALGLEIKRRSPAKQTFVVGYTNDWRAAYVPPADQAHRGGYGERPCEARYLVAEAAEMIVNSAVKSLDEMWK